MINRVETDGYELITIGDPSKIQASVTTLGATLVDLKIKNHSLY